MKNISNIVVIAHDKLKPVLSEFVKQREEWLFRRKIIATGKTAEFLERNDFKVPIEHMNPGKYGGYLEINSMIKEGNVDLVLFFRDHTITTPYHPDIQELLDSCNEFNIPLATNPASAELLIIGLLKLEASKRQQIKNS